MEADVLVGYLFITMSYDTNSSAGQVACFAVVLKPSVWLCMPNGKDGNKETSVRLMLTEVS